MFARIGSSFLLILNLILAYIVGFITLIGFFTRGSIADLAGMLAQWAVVVTAFALLVGLGNLVKVHVGRILQRSEGWLYSGVVVVSAVVVLGFGLISRKGPGDPNVAWMFKWIYQPLGAAIFSLLAFFLTTALFRALRVRSAQAMVLLVVALIVIIGQAPFSTAPELNVSVAIKDWLIDYPVLAGMRAMMLGVTFGAIGISLRVLLGFERPYMD